MVVGDDVLPNNATWSFVERFARRRAKAIFFFFNICVRFGPSSLTHLIIVCEERYLYTKNALCT